MTMLVDPYVDVRGQSFYDQPGFVQKPYLDQNRNDVGAAARQWVAEANRNLLAQGFAVQLPDGTLTSFDQLSVSLKQRGYTGPTDRASLIRAYNQLSPTTAPLTNNCAQCATGQNTGACAGCAPQAGANTPPPWWTTWSGPNPATPPGFVTTGTGWPVSTTSGLPFGATSGPLGTPVLGRPMWMYLIGGAAVYLLFFRGGGRRR
jgi:hypothetical protein